MVKDTDIDATEAKTVEGRPITGVAVIKTLVNGQNVLFVKMEMEKGAYVPSHKHDHESVGYVISGKIRSIKGGRERILERGGIFHQLPGEEHSTEALEDTIFLECKSHPKGPGLDLRAKEYQKVPL